jgi:hypothetical protein
MLHRLASWTRAAALILALVALAVTASVTPARAYTSVSISLFYGSLSPYGRWVDYPSYGWCWVPAHVSHAWRPYSEGYWVDTDYGWAWMSSEPFGWATYHYGRWVYDDFYGWVWVPGTVWAPAWVAWRADDDWVGWAPLPPSVGWNATFGVGFTSGWVERIRAQRWCFVGRHQFVDRDLGVRLVSTTRNVELCRETRNVTRFDVRGGRPVNRGVDVASIERSVGRPVNRFNVADASNPTRGRMERGQVSFFRPTLKRAPASQAPQPQFRLAERGGRGAAHGLDRGRGVNPGRGSEVRGTRPADRIQGRGRGREQNVTVPYVPQRENRARGDRSRAAYMPRQERERAFTPGQQRHAGAAPPSRYAPEQQRGAEYAPRPHGDRRERSADFAPRQQSLPQEHRPEFAPRGGGPRQDVAPREDVAPRGRGHQDSQAMNSGPARGQERGAKPAPEERGKGGRHGGHGGE